MKPNTEDMLVIRAVLLYILKNCKDKRDVYSIVKTAYYAQREHFVEYGTPLYRDSIIAMKFGPVPSVIYNVLRLARGDSSVLAYSNCDLGIAQSGIRFENEDFYPIAEPDLDYLSESDIKCLNDAIDKVSSMDFSMIVNDTHEAEWKRVFNGRSKNKVMNNLNIAKDGGADDDRLNYLQEYFELDKYGLQPNTGRK